MSEHKMEFGIVKREKFITTDGNEFDDYETSKKYQEHLYRNGIKIITEFQGSNFGDYFVMPKHFYYIIFFSEDKPVVLLAHQLYLEMAYEALKTLHEVKVLGLDKNSQPLEMITVASRKLEVVK